MYCHGCRASRKRCSFHDKKWGVSRWPKVQGPTNDGAVESRVQDREARHPRTKNGRATGVVAESRSEGPPPPLPSLGSSSLAPASLPSLSFPGSIPLFDVEQFASVLQQSEHSSLSLAYHLADIKAARDKAESELAVTSSLVTKRIKLVDNLISKYEAKLSSMERMGLRTSTSSPPTFVQGSSKDGEVVETSDGCGGSENFDQIFGDD